MRNHTPFSHDNVPAEDWDYEGIYDANGKEIGMTKELQDAVLIVRAINSFDDLVEALQRVKNQMAAFDFDEQTHIMIDEALAKAKAN